MPKIYTRGGDGGCTSLFSGGRVHKHHPRLHACGTLDELDTALGVVRAMNRAPELDHLCRRLQTLLFVLSSDLATPLPADGAADTVPRVGGGHVKYVEDQIDALSDAMPPLDRFILPGGCGASAFLHQARAVCRRAERHLAELAAVEPVGDGAVELVNRMSDYLFVLARFANHLAGVPDEMLDRSFPEAGEP